MHKLGVVIGGCALCKYLHDIFANRNTHGWERTRIQRQGSALIHNEQRVFMIRSGADKTYDGIQVGYVNLPTVSSSDYFVLLRAWLERCDKDHRCKGAITKNNLPTRVIDIGEARNDPLVLRDSKEINTCSYIALSHCWGEYKDEEKQKICTHKDNLEQRKAGFQVQDLPKTFQDAIDVTRQLGKRYLWIDSLCIVQSVDGKETDDWKVESKRMEVVFSSAYCTLAASAAKGSHEGFLKPRPSSQPIQIETKDGGRLYVSAEVDNFFEDIEKSPLNGRGWVLQERILSRRTIHFGAKQTYFECGEGVCCENFTFMQSPMRKEYFSMDPQFPNRLLKAGNKRILEFIQHLCQDFSQRHLTNTTDRSVAFSGLESRIINAINTKSIYGIPEKFLNQTLLWQRPEHGKLNRIEYDNKSVPSWSWMTCSGPIEYAISFKTQMDCRTDLSFKGNQKNTLSAAEVAEFKDCEMEGEETTKILKRGRGKIVGWMRYDRIDDIPEFHLQKCIVVGRNGNVKGTYYVLVVSPTSKHEYTRIGIGEIESSYLLRIEGKVSVI